MPDLGDAMLSKGLQELRRGRRLQFSCDILVQAIQEQGIDRRIIGSCQQISMIVVVLLTITPGSFVIVVVACGKHGIPLQYVRSIKKYVLQSTFTLLM
jgi:hypothetical protein